MIGIIDISEDRREPDLGWLFEMGTRELIPAGTTLVREGVAPDAIYVVIEGELSVTVLGLRGVQLAILGPGELIGEMAFLEGSEASATIIAEQDTEVLKVSYSRLAQRLETDTRFAAQVYRAFALIAEQRLRRRVGSLVADGHSRRDFSFETLH